MPRKSILLYLGIPLVVLFIAAAPPPYPKATWCNRPDSTVCACNCAAALSIPSLGGTFQVASVGLMNLTLTNLSEVAGICSATQQVTQFEVQGSHPLLGNLVVHLDLSATPPPSLLVNTVPMQLFPAQH